MTPSIFVVIPTIRTLDFLSDWQEQFRDVTLIICEDHPVKEIPTPVKIGRKIHHYSWKEIDQDLKKSSWIVPRKVSAIRNYGFLQAYRMGADIVVTLDDDCYPVPDHNLIEEHSYNLSLNVPANWMNTYPDARFVYTRGMPYLNRSQQPVMLSHGLWTNSLDFDAPTHLQHLEFKAQFSEHFLQIIPSGAFFPMCSMNMAFRRDLTPLMYFPLTGEDAKGTKWGFDRFDDIWAGIFAKKIMDHLKWSAVSGSPFVEHVKASNPFINLQKEALGISANEELWQIVERIELDSTSASAAYRELASKLKVANYINYFNDLKRAMKIWSDLFT